jgi:hypothetical protein
MQNVWQDHFPEPCGGEGRWGTNWPTEVVEIATLCEFDENYRFFTTSCDPSHIGHIFRLFKYISP